jgi:3-methyladenine DNA glycosylase/8-oxoguanine DNA glycosylase
VKQPALAHLRAADPVIARLLETYGDPDSVLRRRGRQPGDAYGALVRAIVGQQLDRLAELPDDEVAAQLVAVKGLGQWSADMFLIFHLGRPDVLPVGDLGIRRAVQRAYGLTELPDAAALERIAEPWRPHRSLACLYLWRSLDSAPV